MQASIAGDYASHDPYFHNIVLGGQSVGDESRGGVKGTVRFSPFDGLEFITRADVSGFREHPESYSELITKTPFPSLANSIVGNYSQVALSDIQLAIGHVGGVSQEINYQAANWLNIKSLSAFRTDSYSLSNDNDSTDLELQLSHQAEKEHGLSQEFDFQVNTERFQGIAGYYFFHDDDMQLNNVALSPSVILPAPASQTITVSPLVTSTSNAGFVQGTYVIVPRLSVVAGIRYTSDGKTFEQNANRTSLNPPTLGEELPGSPIAFSQDGHYAAVTPKGGINFQLTDDALIYASATKGYKSGGFNFTATSPAIAGFAPESVWSYEGGAKTEWFEHRLRVNATGFLYDYRNLQVSQLVGPGTFSIGNAAAATGKGAELEAIGKPTPRPAVDDIDRSSRGDLQQVSRGIHRRRARAVRRRSHVQRCGSDPNVHRRRSRQDPEWRTALFGFLGGRLHPRFGGGVFPRAARGLRLPLANLLRPVELIRPKPRRATACTTRMSRCFRTILSGTSNCGGRTWRASSI